jgi:hypothetical protein
MRPTLPRPRKDLVRSGLHSWGRLLAVMCTLISILVTTFIPLSSHGAEPWTVKDFEIYEGRPPGSLVATIGAEVGALIDPLPDDIREEIEQYLGEVADILERDGWEQPYLEPQVTNSEGRPAFRVYYFNTPRRFPAARQSEDCGRATPVFIINSRLFLVDGAIPPKGYQDLAHEVFHGVQVRYPLFQQDCENDPGGFISEGTAQAIGADVAAYSSKRIDYPNRTAGSWAAHRWGLRAYDHSLLTSSPRPIIYGASSFWRYLGEHAASSGAAGTAARKPDYTYLQKFLNSAMARPVTAAGTMNWLNEQVSDKDKLINQRLNRLYPNFATTFAAYGGTRVNPSGRDPDPVANTRANRRLWLESMFLREKCPAIAMSEVQESPAFVSMTLNKFTASCVQLEWDRAQTRDLQVRVFHHDKAALRNITLGTKQGSVVIEPTLVKAIGKWSAVWLVSVEPGDEPIDFIFTNMAKNPADTKDLIAAVEFGIPWWTSDMWQGPVQPPPGPQQSQAPPSSAQPSGQVQNQRVQEEVRQAMETLNPGLIAGSEVNRSPATAPCADAFVDIACGPMTTISLELLPGGMYGSGWTSSGRGGVFGQFAGMMSGMGQISQQEFGGMMKDAVAAQESMDGAKVTVSFPLIDYGFTGDFDNASLEVSAKGRETYKAIGPQDTQPGPGSRYPLSGYVKIEQYTPWEMTGSYSGDLVNIDKQRTLGEDANLPIDRTVSGRFHIVAPWKDDDRTIIEFTEDPTDSVTADVEQMMGGLSNENRQIIEDAVSGNTPSAPSGGSLENVCTCECGTQAQSDELCALMCEEEFAACDTP